LNVLIKFMYVIEQKLKKKCKYNIKKCNKVNGSICNSDVVKVSTQNIKNILKRKKEEKVMSSM